MEKELTKEIKKEVDKEVKKEVDKEVKREVEKRVEEQSKKKVEIVEARVEKEVERRVEKEIEKRLPRKIYEATLGSALKFKDEFRNQIIIAVIAAFGFLIALAWREPIQEALNYLLVSLGLRGTGLYIKFLSALIITVVAAIVLIVLSRWKVGGSK